MYTVVPDIDECQVNNGNCSDRCVNDIPYHHCECPPGGQLDQSNRTCVFNANCTLQNDEVVCECLPGYNDSTFDQILNCLGMYT